MQNKSTIYLILTIVATVLAIWNSHKPVTPSYKVQMVSAKSDTVAVPQIITVEKERVRYIKNGAEVSQYVPPEGKLEIDQGLYKQLISEVTKLQGEVEANGQHGHTVEASTDSLAPAVSPSLAARIDSLRALLNDPVGSGIISVKNKGFCFRPMIGAGYSDRFDGFAGAKVMFWNRYGVVVGATTQAVGGAVTRRLDFIPFTRNIEGTAFYGYPFKKDGMRVYAGIAINL